MEIARLQIAVDAARAKRDLQNFGDSAKSVTSTIKGLLAPIVALGAAAGSLSKLVAVQRKFDVLNAGLQTATGSAEGAAKAFEALQEFAANTPYSLDQAVEGFTKLVNLGLTPSEAALNSYGNTAAALGKDLSQMVEAVADAATGEFERLKEFGIKTKREGDSLSFTFQGLTTKIGNNAAEIEKYLTGIGDNQFAGAMEKRINTLDGALSNFDDTLDGLLREVSAAGFGAFFEEQVRTATAALQELTDQLASGQMQAELSAIAGKFEGFSDDISESLNIISELFKEESGSWVPLIDNNVNNMIDTFRNLPENVRALIQIMTVEIASGFDQVKGYARAFNDGINAIFTGDTFAGVGDRLEAELSIAQDARMSSISAIINERDAALSSFDSQIEGSKKLREEYDNREREDGDRLAKYKLKSEEAATATGKLAGAQKAAIKEAQQLSDAYQSNADVIADLAEALYQATLPAAELAERQAVLRLNEYATKEQIDSVRQLSAEMTKLSTAKAQQEELENKREAFGSDVAGTIRGEVDPLSGGAFDDQTARYEAERSSEQARYQEQLARLNEALSLELVTKQEYANMEVELAQTTADRMAQITQARNDMMMNSMGSAFGQMSTDLMAFANEFGEQNSAMFKVAKASAIAQTIIQTYQSAQAAFTSLAGIPIVGPALGAVAAGAAVAGGMARVSAISSQAAPSFDGGGFTGGGARAGGLDGKGGFMAMLHPNETVIDHTKGQGMGGGVTVNVIESRDKAGTQQARTGADGKESVDVFVADIYGDGPRARAMQSAFGLQRQGR